MKVITCPDEYTKSEKDIFCFLGGGITNCPNWQKEVINILQKVDPEHLVVFNPRRDNFPINNPNASDEQIQWEYKYLECADIFSMYFCESESDQPICMYELGRNIERMNNRYMINVDRHVIISSEKNYKRVQDVVIQTKLAIHTDIVNADADYISHAKDILFAYLICRYGHSSNFREAYNKLKEKWPY